MRGIILAACAILVACSGKTPEKGASTDSAATDTMAAPTPPAGANEIHIATSANSYAPGASVAISIHNATARQFAFNPCTRTFEREGHGRVEEPPRMCTMEAWLLEPNATREATVDLPAGFEPGTYRVNIDFSAQEAGGIQVHATSNAFQVTSNK